MKFKLFRKFIYFFTAFLLFAGTIGLSLNIHFCCGKLISFSFTHKPQRCCDGPCKSCKDVSIFYKIKADFEKQVVAKNEPLVSVFLFVFAEILSPDISQNNILAFHCISPPPLLRYPLNILHSVFRL